MADMIHPDVMRILAPNPGPLTGTGTNTYVVGNGKVVIDPGPDMDAHLNAILDAAPTPSAILITHSHIDHTALVPRLQAATGAPTYAFGDYRAGRENLPDLGAGFTEGGGTDSVFRPDIVLHDGECFEVDGLNFTAHWTPGHFPNHLAFGFKDALFSGDVIMGWSSTLIAPPEGSVAQFMQSCSKMMALPYETYLPGHGDPVQDGPQRAADLAAHRQMREGQVLAALDQAPGTATDLAARIYDDLPPALLPAAAQNVLSHLIDLWTQNRVTAQTERSKAAVFGLAKPNSRSLKK
ncbi:MAG: MBL fold metallo-hydrolase [Planktomarina sp.]